MAQTLLSVTKFSQPLIKTISHNYMKIRVIQ